jgi:hypothetical protein
MKLPCCGLVLEGGEPWGKLQRRGAGRFPRLIGVSAGFPLYDSMIGLIGMDT